MPPRFAYWTIILDGTPTSFRTKEREEILPLFNQLKAKNPSALLKWFSGGTLLDSPEPAREAREREKVRAFRELRVLASSGRRPTRGHRTPSPNSESSTAGPRTAATRSRRRALMAAGRRQRREAAGRAHI